MSATRFKAGDVIYTIIFAISVGKFILLPFSDEFIQIPASGMTRISLLFSCLVVFYLFFRMYIILHRIDENKYFGQFYQTIPHQIGFFERFLRLMMFVFVIVAAKPVHLAFIDELYKKTYSVFSTMGIKIVVFLNEKIYVGEYFSAPLLRDRQDQLTDSLSNIGFDRIGLICIGISICFVFWDITMFCLRSRNSIIQMAEKSPGIKSTSHNFRKYITFASGFEDAIDVIIPKYKKFHAKNIAIIWSYCGSSSATLSNRVCYDIASILTIAFNLSCYIISFKFFERLALFVFGLVLTSSPSGDFAQSSPIIIAFGTIYVLLSVRSKAVGFMVLDFALNAIRFLFGESRVSNSIFKIITNPYIILIILTWGADRIFQYSYFWSMIIFIFWAFLIRYHGSIEWISKLIRMTSHFGKSVASSVGTFVRSQCS